MKRLRPARRVAVVMLLPVLAAAAAALPQRRADPEADSRPGHGHVFTRAGRRLASTQIENLERLDGSARLGGLAALAEFSTQLLLREGSNRARILELNREIKREAYNRHYDEERYRRKLALPVRSDADLRRFLAEGYRSLASPDLVELRLSAGGLRVSRRPARLLLPLGQAAYLPVVAVNELDRPVALEMASRTLHARQRIELAAGGARGVHVELRADRAGFFDARLDAAAGPHALSVELPVEVRPTGTLRVDLRDASGRPTAARVTVRDASGLARAPVETFLRLVTGDYQHPFAGGPYFHAEGTFELRVPEGEASVEVTKGFEHRVERRRVRVAAGGVEPLAVRLARVSEVAREGWYSGETHIHANALSGNAVLPEDVWLQARGEDLNVANLLTNNTVDGTVHDREHFTGRDHPLSRGDTILRWSEEMRSFDLYGHMGLLGIRELVAPLYTGFPGTRLWEDYPANYTQAEQARAQGAAITQVHPSPGDGESVEEYPVDLALGMMDALDVMSQYPFARTTPVWHRLLNCGLRCAVSAGTDTFDNNMYALVIGSNRVYARTEPPLTYAKWIEAFKKGRSFATNGPLLAFTVDGRDPGEEIRLPARPASVEVRARAWCLAPIDRLDVLANGAVVHSVTAADRETTVLEASCRVPLERSAWIALRVTGPAHPLAPNGLGLFAHSSPVYCLVGGAPIASPADARFFVAWIDRLIAKVRAKGDFASEARRQEVVRLFERGRRYYERMAAE